MDENLKEELASLTKHLKRLEDKLDADNSGVADLNAKIEELKSKIAKLMDRDAEDGDEFYP